VDSNYTESVSLTGFCQWIVCIWSADSGSIIKAIVKYTGDVMPDTGVTKILIREEEIEQIVAELGREITQHYRESGGELIVVGLLRGSFVFMADLIRKIHYPLVVDFMAVSSYGDGTVSTGDVKIVMDLDESVEGRHVLLVEDIIDTGSTFQKIIRMLENRNPLSLRVCTFLSKPSRRKFEIPIDFCGRDIPDEFVCGYGLDFAQKYRNLPYVGVLGE
jgi:hypoxanthine phosphoribosyltransferase